MHAPSMPDGLAEAVAAHLTRVAGPPRTTHEVLTSAYARRLSLLRQDVSDGELAENASLIARLEARYQGERTHAADRLA